MKDYRMYIAKTEQKRKKGMITSNLHWVFSGSSVYNPEVYILCFRSNSNKNFKDINLPIHTNIANFARCMTPQII